MEYKKKLKQRFFVAIFYIAVGLVLILADVLNHFENTFIFSFGFALMVMGIARLIRHRKITKDEKSMRKQELIETDERNRMLSERAKSWAFSYTLMIAGIVVIVLSLSGNHELAQPFAWLVCGMTVLYWICWILLGKKY
ncbi:MAG: hypothetical protein IJE81_02695 [Oscillospiraceae bacterium]|nr:hypothetical protein [Oscillospiraceae bacterium]MBQ7130273.1 hypothetical protein [Oscillospiraceae bacterium]